MGLRWSVSGTGRVYKVALGRNPDGPKEKEGDDKIPEGLYSIDSRNTKSSYHFSLHISYPNLQDIQRDWQISQMVRLDEGLRCRDK